MRSSGLSIFLVSLGIGIPLLVATILLFVFGAIRRARAGLEAEGVVLDSGRQWITIRYRDFRAPGVYKGLGITKRRASFVLTRRRLVLTPGFQRRKFLGVERGELGRFTVGVAGDGSLHLHSDDPPNATGSIDYRVKVSDAAAWVTALTEAGARPRAD